MKDHVPIKSALVAGCISVSACLQVFPDYFIYWRESLLGEFWRLWTAHWVHVGWIHFLLNMMAFACLPFIFPHTKVWHILSLLILLPPFISLVFYFICPISMHMQAFLGYSMGYIPQLLWFTCNTVKKGILHFWS